MAPGTTNLSEVGEPAQRRRARRGRPSTKHPQEPGTPKPWRCEREGCQNSFSRKSDLIRHDHTHTGTRNHKCPFENCGKTFIQTSALTVHKRTHTGEKPHECKVCKKRFSDSSSLARHRRTHSNNPKSFPCPVTRCGKGFSQKSALRGHIEREHPEGASFYLSESGEDDKSAVLGRQSSMVDSSFLRRPGFISPDGGSNTTPFGASLPSQHGLPPGEDVYYATQPPTPSAQSWQYPSRLYTNRAQRPHLPLSIPGLDNYYEVGPLSAPVYPGHPYAGHHSFTYMATVLSPPYPQEYPGHASVASSPITQEHGVSSSQNYHQQASSYHSQAPSVYSRQSQSYVSDITPASVSLPPTRGSESQVYASPIELEATPQPQHSTAEHSEHDIFHSIEPQYQEPQDGGTIAVTQHYQLPSMTLNFAITDEDKILDDLGEPLPSQVI